jgi:GNAT superfamily N-acetyltransferase
LPKRSLSIVKPEDCKDEPLGNQDRAAFSCRDESLEPDEVEPVDAYFNGEAIIRDIRKFEAAAFVILDDDGTIISFYTLSNASIHEADFSNTEKKKHSYEFTPATLIGYLGVNKPYKRQGFAKRTVQLALDRCLKLSRESGSAAVIVDVETKNQFALDLYYKSKFRDLKQYTTSGGKYELLRLFIPMKVVAGAQEAPAQKATP